MACGLKNWGCVVSLSYSSWKEENELYFYEVMYSHTR